MSRLACDPQRLADLARILRSAQNEIELQIRLTEIGDLAIPQVHSYLQQSVILNWIWIKAYGWVNFK